MTSLSRPAQASLALRPAGLLNRPLATFVVTVIGPERRRGFCDPGDLLEQGRLVVLDLDDQRDIDFGCDLEVFF
jgi:hypothetical protein